MPLENWNERYGRPGSWIVELQEVDKPRESEADELVFLLQDKGETDIENTPRGGGGE